MWGTIRTGMRGPASHFKPPVKATEAEDAGDVAKDEIATGRLKVTPRKAPPKLIDLAKQNM